MQNNSLVLKKIKSIKDYIFYILKKYNKNFFEIIYYQKKIC